MIPEWNLLYTTQRRIKDRKYEVAVIPTGATEAQHLHLPEGQDVLHTSWIANRACELAWPQCESVICLPAIPFGVDCNLLAFPLSIHVSQHHLDALITDVIKSLRHHGIRKIVILNGHGGNDFGPLVRQVQHDLDVHVFRCDWWAFGQDHYDQIFSTPEDHSGEMETSVALHLYPEYVEFQHAQDAVSRPWAFEALRKGWVKTSRDFGKINEYGACGNPLGATAEKGKRFLDLVCERLSGFFVELARAPVGEFFPHAE